MSPPTNLYWFPAYVDKWLSSPAIGMMLPEQEGAYWRLLLNCWGDGSAEPSLPVDDAKLAQMSRLGRRWVKLGGLVREQFDERDGRLYNAKLSEVWHEQQLKHGVAVFNGRKGAEKRKQNRSKATSPAIAGPLAASPAKPQHLELERLLVEPAALTSMSPPKALAVEPARPAERPVEPRITTGQPTPLNALIDRFMARAPKPA